MKNKAVFFDRDGTLIKDVNYLSRIDQIEILPGTIDFCLRLQKKDYLLFVVTNQSGVARGFFDEQFVKDTHNYLSSFFKEQGVYFKKFYYCPHHPTDAKLLKYKIKCSCRKPAPGMIFKATEEFDIDLSQSIMLGNKEIDVQAGRAAGCKSFYIQDLISIAFDDNYVSRLLSL